MHKSIENALNKRFMPNPPPSAPEVQAFTVCNECDGDGTRAYWTIGDDEYIDTCDGCDGEGLAK